MYNIIYTGKKYSLDLQSKAVSVPWLNWNVNTVYAGKYLSSTQLHWPLSSTYVTLSCHSINSLVQNRVSGSGIFQHVSSLPSSCCLHWIIKTMIYKEPYWTYWQLFAANRDGSSQIYGSHPTDKKPSSYYMTEIALGPHKNIWQGGGTSIQVNMSHNLNRPYMYCTYTSYLRWKGKAYVNLSSHIPI